MIDTKIKHDTAQSIRDTIIELAHSKSMSYDTISRKCADNGDDVSKSTIAAFFNNPDLDIGYKKLMAISRAVSGYDISIRDFAEPLPLKKTDEAEYMKNLMEAKKDRIIDLENHYAAIMAERDNAKRELQLVRDEHRQEIRDLKAEYEKSNAMNIRDKRIWRAMALFMLIALAVFCVIDLVDTNSGWIQAAMFFGLL